MQFKNIVSAALLKDANLAAKLARQFQCPVTTPSRWASGVAVPHPRLQKLIIDYIRQQ